MAVNFPSNPTNGQTITASGITYAYDSTQGVWSDSPQGLTQAIDALTDVDTSTSAPTNGQTLQWNSTDSEWQPADSSAGVTVYATIDDLPLTGIAEGSMALVDSTDKLYIFSDSGWYSISIVNTTPSISGVNTTYSLAQDGTATTLTVSATDPEGLPLTYSIVSDTSGNVATVTQGTGSNTNQWTITPTTNTANGGNFTLVFRASDGVNIASASSTFSLVFVLNIPNSQYTSALFTSVGANNAVNNSFDDASTNNHTITANGNVTQNTFSPYRSGGYSTYFDGLGDYLSVANDADLQLGTTSAFTVEFWIYIPASNSDYSVLLGKGYNTGTAEWYLELMADGAIDLFVSTNGTSYGTVVTVTSSLSQNTWHHIAFVRESTSNVKVYTNGSQTYSSTGFANWNVSTGPVQVGGYNDGTSTLYSNCYISDVRIVKGTAVYTSAFTAPTERLTAVTNTSLLACHLPYIADGSTNSHAITVNGNTKTEPFAPYEYLEYSSGTNGGSAYFDGSSDYLTIPSNSAFTLDGDFTIEGWFYSDGAQVASYPSIISTIGWSTTSFSLRFNHLGHNNKFFVAKYGISGSGGSNSLFAGTISVPNNAWSHFALVRSGTTCSLYVNGKLDTTATDSTDFDLNQGNQGTAVGGGNWDGAASSLKGSVSNLRVVKGTAVYTADFTPPTAPLTAITNTSLLLNGTDAGIIDKSQSLKPIILNNGAKSSTTQSKFLSSSMYFDGSNDYLKAPSLSGNFLAEGDWTQEMWIRLASTATGQQIGPAFGGGGGAWNSSDGHQWIVYTHSSGFLAQYYGTNSGGNSVVIASSAPFTANTWHHWAISWDGTTLRFFLDGTSIHTTTGYSQNTMTSTFMELGRMNDGSYYSEGYLSDVRITKGLARYTSNFTAPTDALEG